MESVRSLTVEDMKIMMIPERYHMATIDCIEEEVRVKLEKYIEIYLEGKIKGINLCLTGPLSSGKTYDACAVMKRLKAKVLGIKAMFIDVNSMSNEFLYSEFNKEEGISIYDRIRAVDILLLDDIELASNDVKKTAMMDLLRYRVAGMKSTIIATCLDVKEIEMKYGKKIIEMIKESGLIIELPKINYRDEERKKIEQIVKSV